MLNSFLLAATLAALGGCMVHGSASTGYVEPGLVVIDEAPPPPQVERYEIQPGTVWVSGRWYRDNGRWDWRGGHRENVRAGYVYRPGQWQRRGRGHVYVDGGWNASGRPSVRDHRR
jgi:WXXGXW repeat (2 copies)